MDTTYLTLTLEYANGMGKVTLSNQIGIKVNPRLSKVMGREGYSGLVVVDGAGCVIGLYFAGSRGEDYCVANPYGPSLKPWT